MTARRPARLPRLHQPDAPDLEAALFEYLLRVNAKVQEHYRRSPSSLRIPFVHMDRRGRRWWRIVITDKDPGLGSCYGFLDPETGDLWKAASWTTPAKNYPRGNILRDIVGALAASGVYGGIG